MPHAVALLVQKLQMGSRNQRSWAWTISKRIIKYLCKDSFYESSLLLLDGKGKENHIEWEKVARSLLSLSISIMFSYNSFCWSKYANLSSDWINLHFHLLSPFFVFKFKVTTLFFYESNFLYVFFMRACWCWETACVK